MAAEDLPDSGRANAEQEEGNPSSSKSPPGILPSELATDKRPPSACNIRPSGVLHVLECGGTRGPGLIALQAKRQEMCWLGLPARSLSLFALVQRISHVGYKKSPAR